MSMATLEKAILTSARAVLKNPKLRMADIAEWSTSEKEVKHRLGEDEHLVHVPDPDVWIAVDKHHDKRPTPPNPNAITCPICKVSTNPEDVVPEFAQYFKGDSEFRFACKCGHPFYTFVKLDWLPFEK